MYKFRILTQKWDGGQPLPYPTLSPWKEKCKFRNLTLKLDGGQPNLMLPKPILILHKMTEQ